MNISEAIKIVNNYEFDFRVPGTINMIIALKVMQDAIVEKKEIIPLPEQQYDHSLCGDCRGMTSFTDKSRKMNYCKLCIGSKGE